MVGVGAVGSAACRFLAEAGADVVGFERFEIGHGFGSSHGESRVIRYAYPDPLYTKLMVRAYALWDELETRAGEELLVRCGGLFFGPRAHPELAEIEAALQINRVSYESLTPDALAERFPAIHLDADERALWQADAGFLRASAVVNANVRLAREAGAEIRENAPVDDLRELENFDRVIVTAGAWTPRLFPDLNLPLTVTRQQVTYLSGDLPGYPVWIDAESYWYGFPSDGRIPGVKLARHVAGEVFDPAQVDRTPTQKDDDEARAYAARRFSSLGPDVTHHAVCLYTNTPSEDFLLAPTDERTLLVSACSGHGFKFSVLSGRLAAGWALGDTLPQELERFRF